MTSHCSATIKRPCGTGRAITQRLALLRLTMHEQAAQVSCTATGVPWLGFDAFPEHRRIEARKVRYATQGLAERYDAYLAGAMSFAAFDACVKGWVNHARYADSWGLRGHMLVNARLKPGDAPRRSTDR